MFVQAVCNFTTPPFLYFIYSFVSGSNLYNKACLVGNKLVFPSINGVALPPYSDGLLYGLKTPHLLPATQFTQGKPLGIAIKSVGSTPNFPPAGQRVPSEKYGKLCPINVVLNGLPLFNHGYFSNALSIYPGSGTLITPVSSASSIIPHPRL